MKKLVKIVSFLLAFMMIFSFFQNIYNERYERAYVNYVKYEKSENVDMVFIGTSELWVGVIPILLYNNAGIKSFNLGHSYKSSVTYYYELKYALKEKKPKYAVLDFRSMYTNQLPQNDEFAYRQALYAIPDLKIKLELIKDIYDLDKEDVLSFAFPLLRFHSMWSMEKANFKKKNKYKDINPDFMMGWYTYHNNVHSKSYKGNKKISYKLWRSKKINQKMSFIDKKYYKKIVKLCKNENVELVAVIPPILSKAKEKSSHWNTTKKFFKDNNIKYFDYNNYNAVRRIGLNWEKDYYDSAHLNYYGAIKWSKILAKDLKKHLNIYDHRKDKNSSIRKYKNWYKSFFEIYKSTELISKPNNIRKTNIID